MLEHMAISKFSRKNKERTSCEKRFCGSKRSVFVRQRRHCQLGYKASRNQNFQKTSCSTIWPQENLALGRTKSALAAKKDSVTLKDQFLFFSYVIASWETKHQGIRTSKRSNALPYPKRELWILYGSKKRTSFQKSKK